MLFENNSEFHIEKKMIDGLCRIHNIIILSDRIAPSVFGSHTNGTRNYLQRDHNTIVIHNTLRLDQHFMTL